MNRLKSQLSRHILMKHRKQMTKIRAKHPNLRIQIHLTIHQNRMTIAQVNRQLLSAQPTKKNQTLIPQTIRRILMTKSQMTEKKKVKQPPLTVRPAIHEIFHRWGMKLMFLILSFNLSFSNNNKRNEMTNLIYSELPSEIKFKKGNLRFLLLAFPRS